jgi:hypothetical protein
LPIRQLLLLILSVAPGMAIAAEIEPGEWEFTSVSTSRVFPTPQTATFRRCIKQEEAANPDRWMLDPGQGDCKLTPVSRTEDSYRWRMECSSARLVGFGNARLTRATIEGETVMNGEVQGQKFDLRTKVTGKRLGPCKG